MRVLAVGEAGAEADFKIESGVAVRRKPGAAAVRVAQREPGHLGRHVVGNDRLDEGGDGVPHRQPRRSKQVVEDALKDVLRQARAVDGQDEPPETVGDLPLLAARRGGAGNIWRRG